MKKEYSMKDISIVIKNNLKKIILGILLGTFVSAAIAYYALPDRYQSTIEIIVQMEPNAEDKLLNIDASLRSISSLKDLIISDNTLNEVKSQLRTSNNTIKTTNELKKCIKVENESNSQLIKVVISSESKTTTAKITELLYQSFVKSVNEIFDQSHVKRLGSDEILVTTISPNRLMTTCVGAVIGFLIPFVFSFIKCT